MIHTHVLHIKAGDHLKPRSNLVLSLLDGLVSSNDVREQLVRELLDIQRELNPSESVQPLGE